MLLDEQIATKREAQAAKVPKFNKLPNVPK